MAFTIVYGVMIGMMILSIVIVTYFGVCGVAREKAKIKKAIREEMQRTKLDKDAKRAELFAWYAEQK